MRKQAKDMTKRPAEGRRSPLRPLAPDARIWILNALLLAVGLLVFVRMSSHLAAPVAPLQLPWWALAPMFYICESCVVHFHFRKEAHSVSLGELPLVLALFFASPATLVLAQLLGTSGSFLLHRRQKPAKIVFNLANFWLTASLAAAVFHAVIRFGSPGGPIGWLAAFAGVLGATIVGVLMIVAAISLSEGGLRVRMLPRSLLLGLIDAAATVSLALIGVTILWDNPLAVWLLAVPTGVLFGAYRGYAAMRRRHESLEFLYESTRVAQRSLETDSVMVALLSQAKKMFRAGVAEITLFTDDPGRGLRTTLDGEEQASVMNEVSLDECDKQWASRAVEGLSTMVRVRRPIERTSGIRVLEAMIVPVYGENKVIGTMMVADRLGDVDRFADEELKLLETLANHASVSFENARLVDRLRESLAHLTEMNRLKDDFVASVSHELRTPLTAIKGYVRLLIRRADRFNVEQQRDMLMSVDAQSERLGQLIEDLLVVARIESGKDRAVTSRVLLQDLVSQLIAELSPQARDHLLLNGIRNEFPPIETDAGKVRQILSNLVENAIKYTPGGTRITISARREAGAVVLSVSDEGPGIPAEFHDKIFERFYQVDQSSTREVGGTGLGLYICRRLAEILGAGIELEHSDERGSTFSLTLPHGEEELAEPFRSDELLVSVHGEKVVQPADAR